MTRLITAREAMRPRPVPRRPLLGRIIWALIFAGWLVLACIGAWTVGVAFSSAVFEARTVVGPYGLENRP